MTLQLTFYAFTLLIVVSIPLGVVSALYQDRMSDYLIRVFAILGNATPNF